MRAFGIDVSRWQGDFDFAKAKAEGVAFVIIKGGGGDDGLYVDSQFERNYAKAKAEGLNAGAYWFSKATTVEKAKDEAAFFYEHCLKGRKFELPVYIDVENKVQLAIGKRLLTDVIKAWMGYINDRGFYPGIYSSKSYFASYMYDKELQSYPHWVACWAKNCTYTPESCFGMWQFGGETNLIRSNKIAGVICDQDYMLIDYPAQIKAMGKNGYGTNSSTVESNKSEIKNEKGEWLEVKLPLLHKGWTGGYVRTAQILLNAYNSAGLTVDGVFGTATDKAVRSYQKSRNLAVDGYIGTETWTQLLK